MWLSVCNGLLGRVRWLDAMPSHFVTKRHHATCVGFNLCQMESDVPLELLEEWDCGPQKYEPCPIDGWLALRSWDCG